MNHSCEPNCGAGNAIQIIAMRSIEVGEELTFDYAMTDGSNYDEFTCSCGTSSCRGAITGNDWRSRSLHNRYQGFISPYLVRRKQAAEIARPLTKSEVEILMNRYDSQPREALSSALRIILGRPFAHWRSLVGALPISPERQSSLYRNCQDACDLLLTELNELRGAPFIGSLEMWD